jgi:hypothetical protein
VFAQDDAAEVISDAISEFLNELGELSQASRTGPGVHVQSGVKEQGADSVLSAEDFIIGEEDLRGMRAGYQSAMRALSGLEELLSRLLVLSEESDSESTPSDPVLEGAEEESDELAGESPKRSEEDKKRVIDKAERLLQELDSTCLGALDSALGQPVQEKAVQLVLNVPKTAIAYLLLQAKIRERLDRDLDYELTYNLRKTLAKAFAIDGMLAGRRYGWLVQAWASENCGQALRALLRDDRTRNHLWAFAAAGLAIGESGRGPDSAGAGILAGLHMVTGEAPPDLDNAALEQQLRQIAKVSGRALSYEAMRAKLSSYDACHFTLFTQIAGWSLLSDLADAKPDVELAELIGDELQTVAPKLLEQYKSLEARRAKAPVRVIESESGLSCGACRMLLRDNVASQLASLRDEFVECSSCHRVLIPTRTEDFVTKAVTKWSASIMQKGGISGAVS